MCVCLYVYITYKVSSEDFRYFYQILKVVCDTHTHTHETVYHFCVHTFIKISSEIHFFLIWQ